MIRVTGMNVAGNQATLLHATAATGSFYENSSVIDGPVGTIPFTLSFLGHSYGGEASVGAVRTTIFFIAPSTAVDSQGNNPSSLWQKEGIGAPVELVSGVDDLEIHYGIDTTLADGILNVNRYVDFDDVPDPGQIVTVRSTVSLSSVEAVTDDGQQLRRTISKTVLIRNAQPEA
ncbi:MAG: PilW family protein, partial [Pseudomonadales bacterium]